MDSSGIKDFYHIRVFCPSDYDPEFSSIIESLSDLFVITREGGHYCTIKHRHIRPHLHVWLWWGQSHAALRREINSSCPDLQGNGDYCIAKVKSTNLLAYILKGNDVVHLHGYTLEYLQSIPKWEDPKEYFRNKLYAHIVKAQKEFMELGPYFESGCPREYGAFHCFCDIAKFCKGKDRWLRKNEYFQIAYHIGVINVCEYLERIL